MGRLEKTRCARTSCVVSAADPPAQAIAEAARPLALSQTQHWEVSASELLWPISKRGSSFHRTMRCVTVEDASQIGIGMLRGYR